AAGEGHRALRNDREGGGPAEAVIRGGERAPRGRCAAEAKGRRQCRLRIGPRGAAMRPKNGWALIGTGRIAQERILPAINAIEANGLIAVGSRDAGRAESFARRFGAREACTQYAAALAHSDVTVVAIHTPNALHAAQAIAAA